MSPAKKNRENKLKTLKIILETKTIALLTLSQTTTPTIITTTSIKTVTESKGSQKLFIHPVRHVTKRNAPQKDVLLETMQQTGHFPGKANRKDRVDLNNRAHRTEKMVVSGLQPNILTRNATFHSETTSDWPETTRKICHQSYVLSGSQLWRYPWRNPIS